MTKQGKSLSEIYDLIAVRVIVNTVKDCYGSLGIIHSLWKPIPDDLKTTLPCLSPICTNPSHYSHRTKREPFEIQIRTWEMHRTAEYGIAPIGAIKKAKREMMRV